MHVKIRDSHIQNGTLMVTRQHHNEEKNVELVMLLCHSIMVAVITMSWAVYKTCLEVCHKTTLLVIV